MYTDGGDIWTTSLRVAGINFCFLWKVNAVLFPSWWVCSPFCSKRTWKHWSHTRVNLFFLYSRGNSLEEQDWHTTCGRIKHKFYFFCPSISPSFWTVRMLYNWCLTFPHARQWCLLHVWVNLEVQTIHMEARLSGIHMGALDPKGAPSPTSVPSSWIWVVQKKWRHTGVSVAAHTMLNVKCCSHIATAGDVLF